MPKKILKTAFLFYILYLILIMLSCKPAIGTPWYPRAASDEPRKLYITEISVCGNPVSPFLAEQPADAADKLKKFVEAREYLVNVAPSVEEIVPENITVKAVSSLSKMEEVAVAVEIHGEGVPLLAGAAIPVTIKVKDTQGQYGEVTKVIKITRNEPFDLKLESLTIAGEDAMSGAVTLPYSRSVISAADIKAEFSYGTQKTVIAVVLEKNTIELKEEETIDVKISVKALKGQYKDFEQVVSVTRAQRAEGQDAALEPIEIYVQGVKSEIGKEVNVPINITRITQDDIVVIFKTFDSLPIKLDPNPITFDSSDIVNAEISVPAVEGKYLGWNMKLTIKKNAAAVYNPVDKNGNKKYAIQVKSITEKIEASTYYGENYDFPASKFDSWVLNMPGMSGIVPSYQFIAGSWSGSPEVWSNQPGTIGSGLKAISNVKVYRYKTRSARWAGGEVPTPNPYDDRFYFYRFTAEAAGGVMPDSSLFCVDRYSKFLFYYSDPSYIKDIAGNKVPLDWVDYAVSTRGDHVQFTEPFYMSDPVGYVKEDGTVVIYSWVKDKINGSNYTASKNGSFTKPAEKKASGAGFSPYRNPIEIKRTEVITAENPKYTLAQPLILAQPKALRIKLNAPEEAVMTVKTAPVPEGENLSYQWYTNTVQSDEEGKPIPDAVSPSYSPNKDQEKDCYVYCAVTNTNTKNGQLETVKSDAVKLLITSGPLTVDAEKPRIIKQPEKIVRPINTTKPVTLTVEALSMDNGELSYQWYKNTANNSQTGEKMDGEISAVLNFTVDTSSLKTEYYYCIVTNTNEKVDGNKTASEVTGLATIVVEESYKVTFAQDGYGTITALYDGKLLKLTPEQDSFDNYVQKGKEVTFLAKAKDGYEVLEWTGVPESAIAANKMSATLTVEKEETVTVTFRKIPDERTLTITARRLENIDMGGWDNMSSSWKKVERAYFIYDFRARIFDNHTNIPEFTSIWSRLDGRDLTGLEQVNLAELLYKKGKGPNISTSGEVMIKDFTSLPTQQTFQLDTKLVKYDRKAFGAWTYQQYLSNYNQSVIEFNYNKEKDEWSWKKADIPNNFNFRSNFTNDNYQFEITLPPENFVLARGETKDFTIRYWIELEKPTYAKGTVEVTYTLKWE